MNLKMLAIIVGLKALEQLPTISLAGLQLMSGVGSCLGAGPCHM